ncbi:MAG TPA: tetratricopeptide repeat protein [Thermoanaerobaculia bacterium]|nr:tetratricopeptide repeat protein [Thermoanaerobaculia bacterium]
MIPLLGLVACGSTGGAGLESQLAFGVQMAERGLWSEALFRFHKAEDLAPNDFRVVNNLAVAYEANGQFDEALGAYQRALQIQPDNRDLRRNYARFIEFYRSFQPEAASGEPPVTGVAANDPAEGG